MTITNIAATLGVALALSGGAPGTSETPAPQPSAPAFVCDGTPLVVTQVTALTQDPRSTMIGAGTPYEPGALICATGGFVPADEYTTEQPGAYGGWPVGDGWYALNSAIVKLPHGALTPVFDQKRVLVDAGGFLGSGKVELAAKPVLGLGVIGELEGGSVVATDPRVKVLDANSQLWLMARDDESGAEGWLHAEDVMPEGTPLPVEAGPITTPTPTRAAEASTAPKPAATPTASQPAVAGDVEEPAAEPLATGTIALIAIGAVALALLGGLALLLKRRTKHADEPAVAIDGDAPQVVVSATADAADWRTVLDREDAR